MLILIFSIMYKYIKAMYTHIGIYSMIHKNKILRIITCIHSTTHGNERGK